MGADPRAQLAPGFEVTKSVRLVEPLGRGGMGSVWVAEHAGLRTRVVVKFMSPDLASSEGAAARFAREAAACAQVKSPHVVQMLDHGVTEGNVPFIVMELLEGHDLSTALARGVLAPEETLTVVSQVAKALSRAHAAGILHRDIKPENIFLCEHEGERFAKLLDFGIAKSTEALDSQTKTGQVVGTPFYMSPEQITGAKTLDATADLWSLGVVTFEALTGQRPFRGETIGGLAVAIVSGPMPVPSRVRAGLPPSFDRWFARACSRQVEERFATAKDFADALKLALVGSGPFSLPAGPIDPDASRPSFANAPTVESMPTPAHVTASTGEAASVGVSIKPRSSKPRWPLFAAAGGIVVLGGAAVLGRFGGTSGAGGGTATATASATASASATSTSTPTSIATPTASASASATPTPTPTASATPSAAASASAHPIHAATGRPFVSRPAASASTPSAGTTPSASTAPTVAPSASAGGQREIF
jgi:serine/threonine-protein kinase